METYINTILTVCSLTSLAAAYTEIYIIKKNNKKNNEKRNN